MPAEVQCVSVVLPLGVVPLQAEVEALPVHTATLSQHHIHGELWTERGPVEEEGICHRVVCKSINFSLLLFIRTEDLFELIKYLAGQCDKPPVDNSSSILFVFLTDWK